MDPKPPHFWLTERVLLGLITIVSFVSLIAYVIHKAETLSATATTAVMTTIIATSLGALGTGVGIILQAVFRSDKAEKDNAATSAILAAKMPTHPLNGPVGGDVVPVRVEQPAGDPVPVTGPQPAKEIADDEA